MIGLFNENFKGEGMKERIYWSDSPEEPDWDKQIEEDMSRLPFVHYVPKTIWDKMVKWGWIQGDKE